MDKFFNKKTFHICWICGKEHDISSHSVFEYGIKCDCGGYVVSPSGKVQLKVVPIVKVYWMNEYDAVAAESKEQAKEFYLKETGMDEDEAFEDVTPVPMDYMVWSDESQERKISVNELIENDWKGEPFIAFSTEY